MSRGNGRVWPWLGNFERSPSLCVKPGAAVDMWVAVAVSSWWVCGRLERPTFLRLNRAAVRPLTVLGGKPTPQGSNLHQLPSNGGMRIISLIILLVVGVAQQALSKAAFYGPDWMIANAESIAIVTITGVQTNSPGVRGKVWTYRETAQATVESVLKGELPRTVTLHGGENFICAQVHYQPGRHLVFLRRDGQLLTAINWHLGLRPITGEHVEWFSDSGKSVLALAPTPLSKIIAEVRAQVARQKITESPFPALRP